MAITHYQLPPGLTLSQKKAMAAVLACKPCCPIGGGSGGSGSGSGSGGGGLTNCCGCATFPDTFSFTATSSCLGTVSGTMTRLTASDTCNEVGFGALLNYYFDQQSGTGYAYTDTSCVTGLPISSTDDFAPNKVFNISIGCYNCPSDPTGHHWLCLLTWVDYSTGSAKRIDAVFALNNPSCSPVVFATISGTVVCTDDITPTTDCFYQAHAEPYTGANTCLGSTLTIDISE